MYYTLHMNNWFGIPIDAWLKALVTFICALLLLLLLRNQLLRRAARRWEFLAVVLQRTRLYFILAAALYLAAFSLPLPAAAADFLTKAFLVATFLQLGLWSVGLLDAFLRSRQPAPLIPGGSANADSTTLGALGMLARVIIWVGVGVLVMENISGVRATSLVTSLGITGIAVALAAQHILGDLFSAVSIALDKPFVVGDTISIADLTGTVEKIGIKSVRLRSVNGEVLIFSNSELLKGRLHNYADQKRRRVQFSLNVAYATPQEKLEAIPAWLKEIISAQPQVTFDRAHFKAFGDSALIFETAFFIESPDYLLYMDCLQTINLAIYARFRQEEVAFGPLVLTSAPTGRR